MSEIPASIHRFPRSIVRLPRTRTSTAAYVHDTGPPSARELLDRLRSLYLKHEIVSNEEHRRTVVDICHITEKILSENEKSSESIEEDGVLIRTFIPVIMNILSQTIECIYNNRPTLVGANSSRTRWLTGISRKKKKRNLKVLQIIALPFESCISSSDSDSLDDILVITSNISSVWFLLCDSVPVLGILKPVPAALTKICQAIQTLRSNRKLAEEMLCIVRDDIRMVARKVQRNPTYVEEEFRRDVQDYFSKLQAIILWILKGRRTTFFNSSRDKSELDTLRCQVRDARNQFKIYADNTQERIALDTFFTVRAGFEQTHREIAGMQLRITALVSNVRCLFST
ncbi:hypothetical protein BDP27DRAFT_1336855 [Rhodocollybia butyracea]|uniref:Uncharacterized protein n=1 Tax=Rhodocollybia butyracea TaxID=206335 RepID=A0A9P5U0X5_9AGAR|nr:hypothetical protein BDP27DRAFT_1336855 [Rhodocollybia butyracea]